MLKLLRNVHFLWSEWCVVLGNLGIWGKFCLLVFQVSGILVLEIIFFGQTFRKCSFYMNGLKLVKSINSIHF